MNNLLDALFRFPDTEGAGPEFVGSVLNLISVPAIVVDKKMKVGPRNLLGQDLLPAEDKRTGDKKPRSSRDQARHITFPELTRDKVMACLKSQRAMIVSDFGAPGLKKKRYDLLLCPAEILGRKRCLILLLTPAAHTGPDLDWALKELMSQISGAAAFMDTDVRFREFNQLYLTSFGVTAEELAGSRMTERNPSRQAKILEDQIRHLIAHRQIRNTSSDSLTTATRGIVVASLKAWPVTSADGSAQGLFVIARPSLSLTPLPIADKNAQDLFGRSAILFGPPMFFTHLDGRIIATNTSGQGMLEAGQGDGSNLKTAIPWVSPDLIEKLYRDMLAGSDFSSFMSNIKVKDETRTFRVRAYGIKEIGEITSVALLNIMDVTDAETAKIQLAENANKYAIEKAILSKVMEQLSSIKVGYAVVDRELRLLRVSDSLLEAFEEGMTFFEGRKIYDINPSVRDSGIVAYVQTAIDRRKPVHIQRFPFTLPTGQETVLALGFHPMEVASKQACLITIENLSEQHRIEASHARLGRRLDALMESSDEMVVFTDAEGRVTDLSPGVLKRMGKTKEDLIGTDIEEFIKSGVEESDFMMEFIRKAMKTRKPVRTGLVTVTSKVTGAPVFLDATYIPLLGPDGSLEEVAHIARYRTEMVSLEQKTLEQAQNLQRMVNERTAELTESNVLLENTVERLASMARSGMVLSSLKDAESVIASFLKEVREVLGADFASVALISATDDTSKTTYYSSGTAPPSGVIPADVVERGLARLAVGNGSMAGIEAENPNVLIEEFTFSDFKGLMLVWREKGEFTALDGNLTKLLLTQLSFSLPITRYVTDLRLERDRSQTLRRIAFRTAGATSVGSAVRIVAEELAKVLHADRFFWLVSGNQSDLWLSEVYRGSGLPVRQTRHLKAEQSECLEPLLDACNESHRLFCERFPSLSGDEFTGRRPSGGEAPCPFLSREGGPELARCLRSIIRQAGMLGREGGVLAIAPVTVSPTSWGMLCAYSDVGGAFTQDDTCFMCLAASTMGHMWQAADAAGSVRRLEAEGETVSELAHDLKYPLMRMSDSLKKLASGRGEAQDGEAALEALKTEVERLDMLARELIDTSNRKKQNPEVIDIVDVLEYCLSLTGGDVSDKSIEVRKHMDATPPPIFANPQDVKSILINVLANAFDAAGNGGWVDINIEANGNRTRAESVVLAIQDSGPGVATTELGRIFDPFYSTKEMGSGVGLFSSKKRARANGGDLVCEMGPDGKSRFVVWFPVASG